jgi:MoaA/NifB/PqqE/SkfB family radical SAM enzyme
LGAYQKANQDYILTNGILLDNQPEIYDKLLEHGIKEIRISSHFGIEKSLRSVPAKIIGRVVKEAKKRDFNVQIMAMITPENYQNVKCMCKRSYGLGTDKLKFIKYVKSGRAREEERLVLTSYEKENFFDLVIETREKFNKEDLEIKLHGNFGPRKGSRGEKLAKLNKYCPAGKFFFVVDPDDIVYGCPLLMEFPIGKLVNGKIKIEKELCGGKRDKCITDYLL